MTPEELIRLSQLSPQQAVNYSRLAGAQQYGGALGGLLRGAVGGATGVDTRTREEHLVLAQREAAQEVQRLGSSDPLVVYPVVIRVFQKHGLVQEAMALAKELEDLQNKRQDRTTKMADVERKAKADEAKAAFYRDKIALMQKKDAKPDELLESYGEMSAALEQETDPTERARLQAVLRGLGARLGVKPEKVGGTWKVTVASGAGKPTQVITYNTMTGEKSVETIAQPPAKSSDSPEGKPTRLNAVRTADGRPVFIDKNGTQWAPDNAGGWERVTGTNIEQDERDLPPKLRDKITEMSAALGEVALVVKMFERPEAEQAIGLKLTLNKILRDRVYDRFRPWAVQFTSMLANLSSEILRARSGAAVTQHEYERLRPYLPVETDSIEVARNKLQTMLAVGSYMLNAWRVAAGLPPQAITADQLVKKYTPAGQPNLFPTFPLPGARPAAPAAPTAPALPQGVTVRKG